MNLQFFFFEGDLRKLEAVTTVEMVKFVENTRGGVIFFSTKGKRSSADMMSGGDFDGDIYKIIYNKEILKYITTPDHEPYTADSVPVPPVTPQKQSQPNVRVMSRPPSFILPTPTRTEHETPSFYHSISTPSSVDSTASKLEFDYEGSDSIPPLSARGSMSEKTFVPGIATQPKNVYTRSSWVASGSSRNHANYAQSITPSKSADSSYTSPPRCRIKSVFHNPSQEADGSLKSVFDGTVHFHYFTIPAFIP